MYRVNAPATPAAVDPASVERVYRGRYADFLRVCIAVTGNVESAHDAVQEGFSRGLRSLPADLALDALEPWLWRVIANAARDHARRAAVRSARSTTAEPDRSPGVALPATAGGDVAAALAALPERQRMVVFLRYYADLSYDQIAAALEIRPGTVAATLNSAHTTLRVMLLREAP
jgi:RNA polymerase sigma-70 factor, ECF subfamily